MVRGTSVILVCACALLAVAATVTACSSSSGNAANDPGPDAPASCANAVRDGDEVGVDCGGACAMCAGAGCSTNAECASGTCESGACTAAPPPPAQASDGKKDGDETDVDCGGASAPKCNDGKSCAKDADCATGYCPSDKKLCTAPTYDDAVENGTETDVDCGGDPMTAGFKACAQGKICAVDTDCNGACSYAKTCVDMPSCKPHMGGDTCGGGDLGNGQTETHETAGGQAPGHEDCCRTLPVTGYVAPGQPGKTVYVDKYEVTAGRVRAFIEWLAAKNGGEPDMRAWVVANTPAVWSAAWNKYLPTGTDTDTANLDHNPNPYPPYGPSIPGPWSTNVGSNWVFGSNLMVYVHGHDTFQKPKSYGFTTYWYPPAIMALPNNGVARANGHDVNGVELVAKDELDKKSMTAIPNAILQAFCTWDGGQLATDEVLDFITQSPPSLGNSQGCGTQSGGGATGGRCANLALVNATSDSGTSTPLNYNYPYYDNATATGTETSEGVNRLGAPGRLPADKVKIAAGDEPWMDLHGNLEEAVLDMTGATFQKFGLKYRGIGYNSARALQNPTALTYPEYRSGYTGGRCMRFK